MISPKTDYFIKEQQKSRDEHWDSIDEHQSEHADDIEEHKSEHLSNIEEHKSEHGKDLTPILDNFTNKNSDVRPVKKLSYLNTDVKYSAKVLKFIETHRQWKDSKMGNRGQSKDLYRNDNLGK